MSYGLDAGRHVIGDGQESLHPGQETLDEMADKERFFGVIFFIFLQFLFVLSIFYVFHVHFNCKTQWMLK